MEAAGNGSSVAAAHPALYMRLLCCCGTHTDLHFHACPEQVKNRLFLCRPPPKLIAGSESSGQPMLSTLAIVLSTPSAQRKPFIGMKSKCGLHGDLSQPDTSLSRGKRILKHFHTKLA